jgi:CheY-like chemotaxis protein
MHALIIEDDIFTSMLIEDRLQELGFTTFAVAISEDEAVGAAQARCPDLITADVQLAPGCGLEAVRRICDKKLVPVIYITGAAMEARERCPHAVVIQKPFSEIDLSRACNEAVPRAS